MRRLYQKIFSPHFRYKIKIVRYKMLSIFYVGKRLKCNVCNKSARKFFTHGHIPRKNAKCPYCLSLERTRVLWFYLLNELKVNKEELKVLHFAPETQVEKNMRQFKQLTYYSADIDPNAAELEVDIIDIPFDSNTFDLIICSHVLVEVPDEIAALKELQRVIKPRGNILIITYIDSENKTDNSPRLLSEDERYKKYGANLQRKHGNDFVAILNKIGLDVEVIDYRKILGDETTNKYSLGQGDKETIFKCTKA
ncbi:MAG: class I SAM-dependent methyltransferase [Bacteroidales bacterium]|nr:class I SAM-dependent methyltransferase [Bacteroidales bacterium]